MERTDPSRVVLRAYEGHRAGRPFLDAIEIDSSRPPAGHVTDLETGRLDVLAARATDAARLSQRQLRVVASRPLEAIAIVFEPHRATAAQEPLRRTLAGAIDRASIARVLFQGRAEPATTLLPAWLSGYAPFAAPPASPTLSRAAVAALPPEQRTLTLRAEAADPVAQVVAERVAVDAREAGFTFRVQVPTGLAPRPDLRMVRISLDTTTPDRALARVMAALGSRTLTIVTRETPPPADAPLETVYRVESSLLENAVVIPVVHAPEVYVLSNRVRSLTASPVLPSGVWDFANVWLRTE